MDPKLQPVFTERAGSTAADGRNRRRPGPESRPAQHVLAARAVDAADDRRRVGWACSSISSVCFAAAPIMTPLLMFALMLGSLFVVTRLRNSAWGVPALFAFTFIAGAMLTPILSVAAQFKNGGQLVALSGGMTAAIFFAMATIATVTKRDFSFMSKFLFVGLILVIVASLANLFFQVPAVSLSISAIAVFIFSLYIRCTT